MTKFCHVIVSGSGTLLCLAPESWLFSRHTRQLVNEAMGTFRSLQAAKGDAKELTPLLVKASREYRFVISLMNISLLRW